MHRRILWAAGAAGGGLLTSAFLTTAIAVADTGTGSTVTDNAFTIGDFTFDPGGDGYTPISPLSQLSPLLGIGGASISKALTSSGLARQEFDVYGKDGTELGTVNTNVNVQNLLGIESVQLRVIDADGGAGAAGLPAVGTVYSITDLGGGFQNVYIATPGADGGPGTVTDVLVTPLGNMNLDWLFGGYDATHGLNPGDAFAGLAGGAGESSDNAFTIDGVTFDPGADGFKEANELFGIAPLMNLGGGMAVLGTIQLPLYTQNFDVYDGDELAGTVKTNVNTLNLLGIEATQFTVASSKLAEGADAADLPVKGAVYSVVNLGGGIQNIYTAVPGADGGKATITDTLVTPWGKTDLSSMFAGFDATKPLDPGAALTGLDGGAGNLGENAFTINGITFTPGDDGFTAINPMFGVAPLLAIGGGELAGVPLAPQDLEVYGADGNLLGSVDTVVNVANLFGMIETTQFTITDGEFADGVTAGLPADGTVYSITDLFGWTNIYQAIPGVGDGPATISDVLVTPFGNMDLSWMFGNFDATAVFNPGDILAGLDLGDFA
ncbi:hypothetical protein [Mycolicibacter sinensis]|uniref:PE-PGRS family protein n=1 Tax=Mycolicibacter sinensis (strain JDM601) TaxID=875328 RepID=A0A1A2Y233_MYCSD|nr:hypothetical protein [Mycolicibacter sinensis]OBH15848.1 hypothetical protein A5694_08235 [Mycolicibacter sinensis]OBI31458.1 hypothetical protein A5710_18035 [Mycolicibacter sinensis]